MKAEKNNTKSNNQHQSNFAFGGEKQEQNFFNPAGIQPKLTIGAPNDPYEQEADAMADRVMSMESVINSSLPNNASTVQSKCAECEEEVQRKTTAQKEEEEQHVQAKMDIQRMEEEEELMQPKLNIQKQDELEEEGLQSKPLMMKSSGGESVATPDLESQLNQSKGNGQSLPKETNQTMSQAFGADFSNVKVHTDGGAVQMNKGLQARAFTHGSDIYFNQGEYSPGSKEGKRLLAHELTHVVQQGAEKKNNINNKLSQKKQNKIQRDDDRAYEQQSISYTSVDENTGPLKKTNTGWGTVWWPADDDSNIRSLVDWGGYWTWPRQKGGVGRISYSETLRDWRDEKLSNEQYLPSFTCHLRWEQRKPHERLILSPGVLEYDADGGGGVRVTAHYSYGGYKKDGLLTIGYHNILLNLTYDPKMTVSTSSAIEIGAEYKGIGGKVGAESSVQVSKSGISFVREVAIHSF